MTTLQLSVPDATAERFQTLTIQQQALVSQLITDFLTDSASLTDVMDYISFRATQRGLTPEGLQELMLT